MSYSKTFGCIAAVLFLGGSAGEAVDFYVSPQGGHVPPFGSWADAATNIQPAIDAAAAGDTVWVTNGTYNTGGRLALGSSVTNRVTLTQPLTVRSVNGPEVTVIQGYQVPGPTNSPAAIRCAWLTNGAVLSGFKLTGGATAVAASAPNGGGGGAYCNASNAVVTNCIIIGNAANFGGGGVYQGRVHNSVVASNAGGGTYGAAVFDSSVIGNGGRGVVQTSTATVSTNCLISANSGGGVWSGTFLNCLITDNQAGFGGGAYQSALQACVLSNNVANQGGGAYQGSLIGCRIVNNLATNGGGGVYNSGLTNSFVAFNQVGSGSGGGAYFNDATRVVRNCTIVENEALMGGGMVGGLAVNTIVYFNRASISSAPEFISTTFSNSCVNAPPSPSNVGGISADPMLMSDGIHLRAGSPCIGRGTSAGVTGSDLDGQPWGSSPDIGCDQWSSELLLAAGPRVLPGGQPGEAVVNVQIAGDNPVYWWTKDGVLVANGGRYSDANTESLRIQAFDIADAGVYQVVASNGLNMVTSPPVNIAIACVDAAAGASMAPFTNWGSAALTIQEAVDVVAASGVVLVMNGIYATGGRRVPGEVTNRVVLERAVTLLSVNGAANTVIEGAWDPVKTNGAASVRGVWIGGEAVIGGFTIRNSSATNGGGVLSSFAGLRETVANCVLTNNRAARGGGGAYQGRIRDSVLTANHADNGGAAARSYVARSAIVGNSAGLGGGTYQSDVYDSRLYANSASTGGGFHTGNLLNCIVATNFATTGGGVASATVKSSRLLFNLGSGASASRLTATLVQGNQPYGAVNSTNLHCTFTANITAFSGGVSTNCITWLNGASGSVALFVNGSHQPFAPSGMLLNSSRTYPNFLSDGAHLGAVSPSLGAGVLVEPGLLDMDGQPFANPPAIGCDEWHPAPMIVCQPRPEPGTSAGEVVLAAEVAGAEPVCWWTKDDAPVSNGGRFSGAGTARLQVSQFNVADAGAYQMVASNSVGVVTSAVVNVTVQCVNMANPTPSAPFTNWSQAATSIQDAVDAAADGAVVLVTNGIYASGGSLVAGDMTNRVVLDKPVTVLGMGGPLGTIIEGTWDPVLTNGPASVRAVWMSDKAMLGGFTVRNSSSVANGGAVRGWGSLLRDMVVNCVITNSRAAGLGGGVYGGRLRHARIAGNVAWSSGGGVANAFTEQSLIDGNTGGDGGGVHEGVVRRSQIVSNVATNWGGGVSGSGALAEVCYVAHNQARLGGGAINAFLGHCTVAYNHASGSPAGVQFGGGWNSIVYYNTTDVSNTANMAFNDLGGSASFTVTCSTRFSGAGSITNEPQLLDRWHLASTSPCRGVATPLNTDTDLDGGSWSHPPSIGCDEVSEAAFVGPLSVNASAAWPTVAEWGALPLTGTVSGLASRVGWDFGDGVVLTNVSLLNTTHVWTNAGDYIVTFTAYNEDHPGGVSTSVPVGVIPLAAPEITSAGFSGTNFVVSFPGQPGVTYQLQQTTNLAPPNWQAVGTVTSSGQLMQVMDPKPTNSMRFYRVRGP